MPRPSAPPARANRQPSIQPVRSGVGAPAPGRRRSTLPALLLAAAILLVLARYILLTWYPDDAQAESHLRRYPRALGVGVRGRGDRRGIGGPVDTGRAVPAPA